jgi:DNA ligase-1
MPDLQNGESVQVQGNSGIYTLRNEGGIYSCTCPAWLHQHAPTNVRTCKHLKAYRGEAVELSRVGIDNSPSRKETKSKSKRTSKTVAAALPITGKWIPMLAQIWNKKTDPTNWLMSEKLDGVRAYWDGRGGLWTRGNANRSNKPFVVPKAFLANFPPFPIDGELWLGRGLFQKTVSIVRRMDGNDKWMQLKYMVFDVVDETSGYEERMNRLSEWLQEHPTPFIEQVQQRICQGMEDLHEYLDAIIAKGGEGIMLRKPNGLYEHRRSPNLLKVKPMDDDEARVIGYQPGEGKYVGMLGALECEMPDGKQFNLGTGFSDAERDNPPPIGCLVTYKHQGFTDDGKPRCPVFLRIRTDID